MNIRALVVTPDASERTRLSLLFADAAVADTVSLRFADTLQDAEQDTMPAPDLLLLAPGPGAASQPATYPAPGGPFGGVPVVLVAHAGNIAGARLALAARLADDLLLAADTGPESVERFVAAIRRGRLRARRRISSDIILAAMADAVIITDAGGRISYCNDAACDLTGRLAADMLDVPVETMMALHDAATGAAIEHPVVHVLSGKRSLRLPPGSVLVRADGGEIMIEDSTSPVIGADGALDGTVMVFHDVTASRQLQNQVDYLARHDFLTGLPNRFAAQAHLRTILAQAEAQARPLGVMYLDLDNFKIINDTLGHAAGDQLLVSVTARLRACCRAMDLISRQGGDEFLILMAPGTNAPEMNGAAQRILRAVAQPHDICGEKVLVGCSVGIALYPEHGATGETLLQHADTALHAAKVAGRNTYRMFEGAMLSSAIERRMLENALRLSLDDGGFELFYQPKVALADGAIVGCEALLRWRHPEWGWVSPGDAVHCAEQSGLIVGLGRWVLDEAVRQARRWQDNGCRPCPVAVNVSALELHHADFVEHVRHCLAGHGLRPALLQLELTESSLMRDVAGAVDILEQLRTIGMTLAIDDFGTGYSSLGYLADFPIDVLKVDRSFVHGIAADGPRRQGLLRAVLAVASNLGLPAVAEGIETAAEAAFLTREGCLQGQGFHYSPPVNAATFERLLCRVA